MSIEEGQALRVDKTLPLYQADWITLFGSTNLALVCESACQGLDGCDPDRLVDTIRAQLTEGLSSEDTVKMVIQVAVEMTSIAEPNWQYVAARLLLFHIYQEAAHNRGSKGSPYAEFHRLVERLENLGRYGTYIRKRYAKEEIDACAERFYHSVLRIDAWSASSSIKWTKFIESFHQFLKHSFTICQPM